MDVMVDVIDAVVGAGDGSDEMCGGRNPPAAGELAESAIFDARGVCFAHQLVNRTLHGRVATESGAKLFVNSCLFL